MFEFNKFTALFLTSLILSIGIYTVSGQECGKKHNFLDANRPAPTSLINSPDYSSLLVVGGRPAQLGEYPWQVSLQYHNGDENVHFCGGSIVADKWVVTAAHCFTSRPFSEKVGKLSTAGFDAVAGLVDRSSSAGSSEQRIKALDYFIHEDFNQSAGVNDIALVEVESAYNFGDFVEPICMPASMQGTSGTATVTGWGAMTQGGPFSEILQQLDLTIITDDECGSFYPNKIVGSMICVSNGGPSYTGPCSGDSGGPLVSASPDGGDSYYLSGVISWGHGCESNFPSVLMEVSFFIDWMNSIMSENVDTRNNNMLSINKNNNNSSRKNVTNMFF